jgi:hypothetical protein
MKPHPVIERLIFALLVILSLAALLLVLVSPADVVNTHVVYQGF